jgi:hypothetical protein
VKQSEDDSNFQAVEFAWVAEFIVRTGLARVQGPTREEFSVEAAKPYSQLVEKSMLS